MSVMAIANARPPSRVDHPYPFLTLRMCMALQRRNRKDGDRISINHGDKR